MPEGSKPISDITEAIATVEHIADQLVAGLLGRLVVLGDASREFDALEASLEAGGTSLFLICVQIAVVTGLAVATFLFAARTVSGALGGQAAWRRLISEAGAVLAALVVGFVAARIMAGSGLPLKTLRIWVVVAVAWCLVVKLVQHVLVASRPVDVAKRSHRIASVSREMSIPIGWAMAGIAAISSLALWDAGPGLGELIRTWVVAIPSYLLFAWVVWRHRRTLAVAVAGPWPRSRWRRRLAKAWPGIVIGFLAITFIATQAALSLGSPLRGSLVIITVLSFVATPHLDAMIGNWAQRGREALDISVVAAAGRQTARFVVVALLIALLGTLWATPLAVGLGFSLRSVEISATKVALIALIGAFLWNVIGTVSGRALQGRDAVTAGAGATPEEPRTRLGTLVPLLSGVGKTAILTLVALSILVSLGVTVWPLITGLSVFGLAIGFGTQALVKDVVSGLFFLIDDAFRFGEYIETSGAKGTVEKISIRSVSLRHQRGAVATIPYGQIGKIQNYSRDWVIDKLTFRVAFDTDVEKVRKIFKKIGQDIAADPEIAGDLLEPFKSQGIADVEDGTLLIKAKYKAKAGKQSMIRRAALKAVHDAFLQNGIKAVPKPITSTQDPAVST